MAFFNDRKIWVIHSAQWQVLREVFGETDIIPIMAPGQPNWYIMSSHDIVIYIH